MSAVNRPAHAAPHPCDLQGQGFTYLRNLATEKPVVVTADDCNAAEPCTAEPKVICPLVKCVRRA